MWVQGSILHVAIARSSSDGNTIHYVLEFLWTISRFHIMDVIGPNERQRVFHPVCQPAAPVGHQSFFGGDC